jgi:hypothetical protein
VQGGHRQRGVRFVDDDGQLDPGPGQHLPAPDQGQRGVHRDGHAATVRGGDERRHGGEVASAEHGDHGPLGQGGVQRPDGVGEFGVRPGTLALAHRHRPGRTPRGLGEQTGRRGRGQ